ncbi:MAG: helix-hairpin-helix domain-containing protein [Myxococcales bacterium]|nr:helix-hairpin-helix domain-containing protein [Myxococcales bacterium]
MKKLIQILMLTLCALGAGPTVGSAAEHPRAAKALSPAPQPDEEAPGPPRGRVRTMLHGVVNLNQADEVALELLPGIGPAKAKQILEHRKAHPFRKVEDLTRVKGIGRKTLAKLKPYLAVAGATTLSEEEALAKK